MARAQKTTAAPQHAAFPPGGFVESRNEAQARGPDRDQVAKRAYELFLARGGEHGHDAEDWLQAERELSLGRYS